MIWKFAGKILDIRQQVTPLLAIFVKPFNSLQVNSTVLERVCYPEDLEIKAKYL